MSELELRLNNIKNSKLNTHGVDIAENLRNGDSHEGIGLEIQYIWKMQGSTTTSMRHLLLHLVP